MSNFFGEFKCFARRHIILTDFYLSYMFLWRLEKRFHLHLEPIFIIFIKKFVEIGNGNQISIGIKDKIK